MAKLTISQLTAQLEALRVHASAIESDNESLRNDVAQLTARNARLIERGTALRAEFDALQATNKARGPRPAYTRTVSAEETARREAFRARLERSKELARTSGQCVVLDDSE